MVSKFNNFRPQLVFAEQSAGFAVVLTTEQKLSLYKKSQKSGISTNVLEEVYQRGYAIWNESFGQTAEQFAFDRVNSFIAGGFAAELDEDLMNEEKRGLWANIHAKRKRIESGSGERMRKPGSEGAPTDAALKASQTNEDKDPCWTGYKQVGMKKKSGRSVPNCVPEETTEAQSSNPNDPSSRFDGTDSLVNIYKRATPGQMRESIFSIVKRVISEAEYKTRSGDTLSSIAKRHGTTVKDLSAINNITNANRIGVGQTIKLKAAESPTPRASSSSSETEKPESKPMTRGPKTPEMLTKGDDRNRMSTADQQAADVEKIRSETGRAAAAAIKNADPVIRGMNPDSEMRKALTEPKGKENAFIGSRHGSEGLSDPYGNLDSAKKTLKTIKEATHQGRKVTLNKPFRTPGGPKKSAVYVDPDGDGKAKIVRFGDPKLSIKKDQPARKRSYCARSSGQGNLTKKDSANYWSRRAWDC